MMKITGLSHVFKWENLHNWWLNKYFFAPLYIVFYFYICSFNFFFLVIFRLFVTYGIDLVSKPRYYILVSYRSQNYGIEPSLVCMYVCMCVYIYIHIYVCVCVGVCVNSFHVVC